MLELDQIRQQTESLDRVFEYLNQRNLQISDSAANVKLNEFKRSLLAIKSDLIQIRHRMRKLKPSLRTEPSELLSNMEKQVDDFHRNVHGMTRDVISQELDLLKVLFATAKGVLPLTELELQLNKPQILGIVPREIRNEIEACLGEVERCYSAQSYRGVMAFCGTILEVGLGRKFCEEKVQRGEFNTIEEAEEEIAKLTLGQIASRCRDENIIGDMPGMDEFVRLINSVRKPSLHHRRKVYVPGPDGAKGAINFTTEALKKLF